MTEKRFTLVKCYNEQWGVVDNSLEKKCYYSSIDAEKLCDLLNALHEKNEQLKRVIAENEKIIQSTYDELTKLRCIKKNLRRIKTQWDWMMEAIEYD